MEAVLTVAFADALLERTGYSVDSGQESNDGGFGPTRPDDGEDECSASLGKLIAKSEHAARAEFK